MNILSKSVFTAAVALLVQAAPAGAQQLTYVAATGNDSRPCTVEANPCRTLTRAISATLVGGEIRIKSQLPNEIATINQSLTVNGGGHTMIGRIIISQTPAVVTLRNLHLTGRGSASTGISIVRAAAVHIEDITVERYAGQGILIGTLTDTEVFVSDSSIHDNGAGIVHNPPGNPTLTIHNTHVENNTGNGIYLDGGATSVTGSVFSGNGVGDPGTGLLVTNGGTANIANSTFASNSLDGVGVYDGGQVTILSSVSRDNGTSGIGSGVFAQGAGTLARVARSVFTNNDDCGLEINSSGVAETLRVTSVDPDLFTNVFGGNGNGDVCGGALANVDAQ